MRPHAAVLLLLCFASALFAAEQKLEFDARVEGRVTDTLGAGVAGVSLKVVLNDLWGCKSADQKAAQERKRGKFPVGSVSGECTSDTDGRFSMAVKVALKDGTLPQTKVKAADGSTIETCWVSVTLSAEKLGYFAQSWETVLYQDAPNKWPLPNFARALTLSGRAVKQPLSQPLEGLTLLFIKPEDAALGRVLPGTLKAVTDKAGAFSFTGVDAAKHNGCVVWADSDAWALDPVSSLWNKELDLGSNSEYSLGDLAFCPTGGMKLTLKREYNQTLTAPLTLTMIEPANGRFLAPLKNPSYGKYVCDRLPEGRYRIASPAHGGAPAFTREFRVEAGKTTDLGSELLLDVEQTVEFSTKLIGSVRTNQGPLPGAKITCEPNKLWHFRTAKELEREEVAFGKFPEITVSGEATSESDGGFVIEIKVTLKGAYIPKQNLATARGGFAELAFCHLFFSAQCEGYCKTQISVMVWEGTRTRVDFSRVSRACSVSGRILDGETGKPLADTPLVFGNEREFYWGSRSPELVSTKTDAEGNFKFSGLDVNTRNYGIVMVDSDNYVLDPNSTGWQNIDLYRNQDAKLGDLRFVKCGTIKGQLVNSDNSPLEAQAQISPQAAGSGGRRQDYGRIMQQNLDSGRGAFRFSRLPLGRYQLLAQSHQYLPLLIKDIEVKAAQTIDLGTLTMINAMKINVEVDTGGRGEGTDGQIYAEQIEGNDPEMELNNNTNYRGKRSNEYWRGNVATFDRMPPGKWRITVFCRNYCPASEIVELKQQDVTVKIKLTPGARLKVSLLDRSGNTLDGTVLLVNCENAIYAEHKKSGTLPTFEDVQRNWQLWNRSVELRIGQGYREGIVIEHARPGRYFVIAYMRDKSPIVSDVIELLEGKDTECALREPSASLKVTLKRAGKPAANESVHVFSLAGFKDPLKDEYDPNRGSVFGNYNVMPRVTGEDGMVEFKGLNVGELCVVTAREHLCLTRGLGNPYKQSLLEVLRARVQKASVGENAQMIELPAYSGTWVSFDARQGEGRGASGMLYPLPANCQTYQGHELAGRLEFGVIPKGRYEFISFGSNGLVREIEVNAEGEQHFKFDEKLAEVTVRVLDDKGEAVEFARVVLIPEIQSTFAEPTVQAVGGRMQKDKSFLFRVPEGKFRALAMAGGRDEDEIVRLNSVKVDVKAGKNPVSITINENTGTIRLHFNTGRSNPMGGGMIRMMVVDDKGKVLEAEGESWFNLGGNSPVICVPPGRYNLRFDGTIKEIVVKDIEVRAGEWTTQEVDVEALACPMFRVSGPGLTRELLASAEITYHQADGKKSKEPALACLPKPMMITQNMPSELGLQLFGLDSDMTEVRIKIKGYKELKLRGWRDYNYNREPAKLEKE